MLNCAIIFSKCIIIFLLWNGVLSEASVLNEIAPPSDSSTKLLYPVDEPVVLFANPFITAGLYS